MAERDWRPFVYGGLASCAAEFGTFPIDTTKTRLQIQGQKLDKTHVKLKYHGMIDAFFKISKQEGFKALYAGIAPAVLRQATYGTIKFGTYYSLKKFLGQRTEEDIVLNIGCAVVSGIVSSSIANPTDVLKVRMQVVGVQKSGIIASFQEVYRLEGICGLWRGVGPTAQRAAVIAAVELPVYDMSKQYLKPVMGDTILNYFLSSFVASLGSAIASTPIDVIRTRLMNQKKLKFVTCSNTSRIYKNSMDCFVQTVKNEGFLALYKGFIPTWHSYCAYLILLTFDVNH
ncbi:hypothetical protein RUM44_007417 [Polyplax serrata]|uniref:Uncharacterized protein n=1 Tax=Polyplax serrata TaxID=468196 RepID=A0ABR1B0L5_POLSC